MTNFNSGGLINNYRDGDTWKVSSTVIEADDREKTHFSIVEILSITVAAII